MSEGEWFRDWFDEDYLALYAHRDDGDAKALVALLAREVPLTRGMRLLDVGCGPGRHGRQFTALGVRYTGVDLSMPLLRHASASLPGRVLRADKRRLPIRPGTIDCLTSLFTSFGYFTDDAEHAATIVGMAETLRPGGAFVLDFLNAELVRRQVAEASEEWGPSRPFAATRQITDGGRYVRKRITLGAGRIVEERVRLFTLADLRAMFRAARLTVTHIFGDYTGAPLAPGSPRVILIGRAP